MTRHIGIVSLLVGFMSAGCADVGEPEGETADEADVQDSYGDPCAYTGSEWGLIKCGEALFEDETFGGNGRTCETCHPSDDGRTGTLSPADVENKFRYNPNGSLFRHDGADVIGGNTFNRIRTHATILVDMPLPANVSITGSTARNVILARGIPAQRH